MTDQPTNPTTHTAADGTRLVAVDAEYADCPDCFYGAPGVACPNNCMPGQRTGGLEGYTKHWNRRATPQAATQYRETIADVLHDLALAQPDPHVSCATVRLKNLLAGLAHDPMDARRADSTVPALVGLCVAQAHSDGALNSLRLMMGALNQEHHDGLYARVRSIRNELMDLRPYIETAIEKANDSMRVSE